MRRILVRLDPPAVMGRLEALGSRRSEVVQAERTALLRSCDAARRVGTAMLLVGLALAGTTIGALPGAALVISGWWVRRRAGKNVQAVERGFSEFLRTRPQSPTNPTPTGRGGPPIRP